LITALHNQRLDRQKKKIPEKKKKSVVKSIGATPINVV